MKWNYMHVPGCGKPAFRMVRFPALGDLIRARDAETINGGEIIDGERIICGSCGQPVAMEWPGNLRLQNLEAVDG